LRPSAYRRDIKEFEMPLDSEQIQEPVRKLRKLLKKLPADPSVREVHRFRTNSRRIEAALPALELNSGRNGRRILKQISKLRKQAGKVRDMDVLTAFLSDFPRDHGEEECSVRLLEHLGARRAKQAARLHAMSHNNAPELRKRLKRTAKTADKILAAKPRSSEDSDTNYAVAASALKLLSALRQPVRLAKTNLHPYRIKIKELRNLLQMAENQDRQEFITSLGEVKDAIGEWHDWEELIAIAKDVLDHQRNCLLMQRLRMMAGAKYKKAIHLAETMRKKFVPTSNRKGSPRHRIPPNLDAVWTATSALVA
jgi:CHAD domain-containing protein